jgi:hypothetical protein
MESQTKYESYYEESSDNKQTHCFLHKLDKEFFCVSCEALICLNCIEDHKIHENFTLTKSSIFDNTKLQLETKINQEKQNMKFLLTTKFEKFIENFINNESVKYENSKVNTTIEQLNLKLKSLEVIKQSFVDNESRLTKGLLNLFKECSGNNKINSVKKICSNRVEFTMEKGMINELEIKLSGLHCDEKKSLFKSLDTKDSDGENNRIIINKPGCCYNCGRKTVKYNLCTDCFYKTDFKRFCSKCGDSFWPMKHFHSNCNKCEIFAKL